nr:hypothetical protein [uncultured Actinoplanes sp.]
MKTISTVVASAMLLTVAGCGSVSDRESAASAAVMRLLTAVHDENGDAACAVLAPDTVAEVEQSARQQCSQAILDTDLPQPGVISATAVYGQWAQVRTSTDTVFLAVFPGGWRVVAAGCSAQGDRPYDCVVQGG